MVTMVKKTVPRSEGHGWKLQKLHELLHLPFNITSFGHSRNFDTGHMESHLRTMAKKPARTAQTLSWSDHQEQVGKRIDDFQVLAKIRNDLGITSEGLQNAQDFLATANIDPDDTVELDTNLGPTRLRYRLFEIEPRALTDLGSEGHCNYTYKLLSLIHI